MVIRSPGLDEPFVLTESFTAEQSQVPFKKSASQKKHEIQFPNYMQYFPVFPENKYRMVKTFYNKIHKQRSV